MQHQFTATSIRCGLFICLSLALSLFFTTSGTSTTVRRDRLSGPKDVCSDILKSGVFEKVQTLNKENYASKFKTAVCQSKEASGQSNNNTGVSIAIPIEGVQLGIGGSSKTQRVQQMKETYCQNDASEMSESDLEWLMKEVGSKVVVDAWSQCMKNNSSVGGLQSSIDGINGNTFFLRVRWASTLGVHQTTVQDFFVSGATCEPFRFASNVTIANEWITQPCVREGKSGVNISINTSGGSIFEILPSTEVPKSNRDKCKDGVADACTAYSSELEGQCAAGTTPEAKLTCRRKAQCWGNRSVALDMIDEQCRTKGQESQECANVKHVLLRVSPAACDNAFPL